MKRLAILLILLTIFIFQVGAQLERGVKSDGLEEIILVGADDWRDSVAATPLAIWTDDEGTKIRPVLILTKDVNAGNRIGWIDQADLERYGSLPVLHTMASANVSALVINGEGELVKSLVEAAHKENIKSYVTVTLEAPKIWESEITESDVLKVEEQEKAIRLARDLFFQEMGLAKSQMDTSHLDPGTLQRLDSDAAQLSIWADGIFISDRLCPVNQDAREILYDRVEELIEDYEVDGVVLYNIGFLDESHCLCDVCKEEFYKDTGMDLSRVGMSSYNLQLWKRWKEDQVLEVVSEVRNITSDLGPVKVGVAIGDPLDRSEGYNYAKISDISDFMIINSVPSSDVKVAADLTETPIYVRLSDDYVEYTISTQNVEGTTNYIEELIQEGASGLAFEYDVVYTPLWSELEPPSPSTKWLLDRLEGNILGIGNVFWDCDYNIEYNDSFDMAEKISLKWDRSPGAVLVGDNYSAGLTAASIASYLNWPIFFVNDALPNSTESALLRLDAKNVITVGEISDGVKGDLRELNLTITDGDLEFLIQEMENRGDEVSSVVLTNSHDLSLLPPKPQSKVEIEDVDDLFVEVEITPTEIPAESSGEVVRLKVTLTNLGEDDLENVTFRDTFLPGRLIIWSSTKIGTMTIADPYTGEESTPEDVFFNGDSIEWHIDKLKSHTYTTLSLEIEILHPLDAGWTQPLDCGISVNHQDIKEESDFVLHEDYEYISNITYPAKTPTGVVNISWKETKEPYQTILNYYGPSEDDQYKVLVECEQDVKCVIPILFNKPGTWIFNIETWKNDAELDLVTDNFTIEATSTISPINVTAFSFTKIPKLSLTSTLMAGARNGIIIDVAEDPQNLDPLAVEEYLNDKVEDMGISPKHLIVVGGPGSLPFPTTELKQKSFPFDKDIYREYLIQLDDDYYQEVASGRIIGLSVYDASQMVARNLAYDRIGGEWRNKSLLISSPADYPTWPASPVALQIGEYLKAAGLNTENLRWEEATYQKVSSKINNGQNIVYFDYHGNKRVWSLSLWSLMDRNLDVSQVEQLTLAPQTTTTSACLTSRLKGSSINLGNGVEIYIPMTLKDSIALAFLRAGAVNYVAAGASTWIFVSDDHDNNMYQKLVFENATVGESLMHAHNVYIAKMKSIEGLDYEDIDEGLVVEWDYPVSELLNHTVNSFMLLGDPTFRPYLPQTPELPYQVNVFNKTDDETDANESVVGGDVRLDYYITPTSDLGTDWIYWIVVDSESGERMLNAPPALLGEVLLPGDAEEIVVKENGRAVWHDEEFVASKKRVIWPVISPALNETRAFSVKYKRVLGDVQTINVTVGLNLFSLHLDPKTPSVERLFKKKPYQSIFAVDEDGWNYTLVMDTDGGNVNKLLPGKGYVIDSSEDFSVEISGKPVERPYQIELHQGWNLIGTPINETLPINNVSVKANHKRYSYSEAVKEGAVSALLWKYDGWQWNYMNQTELMVPGEAYMIEAKEVCRLEFG